LKSELGGEGVSPQRVDARGKACPLPIVELSRALRSFALCELWSTDPATRRDLIAFCDATGHRLLDARDEDGVFKARVERKRPDRPE